MRGSLLPAIVALPLLLPTGASQAAAPNSTWGFVRAVTGPNILLDDGQLVRLNAGTRIVRADGGGATRDDIFRGSKVIVTFGANGLATEVCVFPPRGIQEVYLSTLAPVRGAACVMAAASTGEVKLRSLAALRVTYTRPSHWKQFRSQIRYDPRGAPEAPPAARFMLKDSFGDLIVDRILTAGQTAEFNVGLDSQATDRLTLEVAAAGEAQLRQDWCLWLDPRFLVSTPASGTPPLCRSAPERLADALAQAIGETKIEGLAIAQFSPVRISADQNYLRDLSEDLLVLLGRKFSVVGLYNKRLDVGAPLPDANRNELKKMSARYVVTGSINRRAEGTVLNACVVRVDDGVLIACTSIRE